MSGLVPVAALRLRQALAGRILWLLPLHFVLALMAARAVPGPTEEARIQAADAAALALAALLGLAAAAVLGAGPLPEERDRPRGTLVLAAPIGAASRVLGTALGTGAALLLLVLGLCASAVAAADLGAGTPAGDPKAFLRATEVSYGEEDAREPGLYWTGGPVGWIVIRFPGGLHDGDVLHVAARCRMGPDGAMPGWKRAKFRFPLSGVRLEDVAEIGTGPPPPKGQPIPEDKPPAEAEVSVRAGLPSPFRVAVPVDCEWVRVERVKGNFSLGLRAEDCRLEDGRRPRLVVRALHAATLGTGLLAAMAAALALSTVAGTGVAAAGALALSLLSLFRSSLSDAASMLANAGAMERALETSAGGEHLHVEAQTGTPPALAPLFRVLADVLPDGTRFDLSSAIAANEVPDRGDALSAILLGSAMVALFVALAILGARRRP